MRDALPRKARRGDVPLGRRSGSKSHDHSLHRIINGTMGVIHDNHRHSSSMLGSLFSLSLDWDIFSSFLAKTMYKRRCFELYEPMTSTHYTV